MRNLWDTLPDLLVKIAMLQRALNYRNAEEETKCIYEEMYGYYDMQILHNRFEYLDDAELRQMIHVLELDLDRRLNRAYYEY
jgi:hypothetical protein